MPPLVHHGGICEFFSTNNAAIHTRQGGICGFFSTSNAAIHTQIQQGGICGLFSTSNAATTTSGRHLRIFFYQ
jgi:hypothetical protein